MREEEMFISQTAPQHMDVDVNVVSLRDDKNVILSAIDLSWLCQLQLNQININTAAIIIHRGTDDDDDNMSFNSLPLTSGSWSQTLKSDRSIHGLPVSGNSGNSAYFSETQNAGESILPEKKVSESSYQQALLHQPGVPGIGPFAQSGGDPYWGQASTSESSQAGSSPTSLLDFHGTTYSLGGGGGGVNTNILPPTFSRHGGGEEALHHHNPPLPSMPDREDPPHAYPPPPGMMGGSGMSLDGGEDGSGWTSMSLSSKMEHLSDDGSVDVTELDASSPWDHHHQVDPTAEPLVVGYTISPELLRLRRTPSPTPAPSRDGAQSMCSSVVPSGETEGNSNAPMDADAGQRKSSTRKRLPSRAGQRAQEMATPSQSSSTLDERGSTSSRRQRSTGGTANTLLLPPPPTTLRPKPMPVATGLTTTSASSSYSSPDLLGRTSNNLSSSDMLSLANNSRDNASTNVFPPLPMVPPAATTTTTTSNSRPTQQLTAEQMDRMTKDQFLVHHKQRGLTYKQIRQMGGFTEAESTLRGRYRTLTKSREARVRKPEWSEKDLHLLERGVRALATTRDLNPTKVPWKRVAEYIVAHGGTYHFGNSTCRKRWDELVREMTGRRGKRLGEWFFRENMAYDEDEQHQQHQQRQREEGRYDNHVVDGGRDARHATSGGLRRSSRRDWDGEQR
ncbi:hypothetical protein VTJ04DRAFT_3970 [Mycothermus thermophilus]|uniref:uncharacterized protein n=1 Tax=Humicola insolens TaxID=85995 RepID=UPI0037449352